MVVLSESADLVKATPFSNPESPPSKGKLADVSPDCVDGGKGQGLKAGGEEKGMSKKKSRSKTLSSSSSTHLGSSHGGSAKGGSLRFSRSILPLQEMTPERTLVEFISTSASFHGIRSSPLSNLEFEITYLGENNVMPANAGAWYLAKRKFYLQKPLDQQLLASTIRSYPNKFTLKKDAQKGLIVEFLESYAKDVAGKKLHGLVVQGISAYFAHKVADYGVYFFDPQYYETTEPYVANLTEATSKRKDLAKNKLISTFFAQHRSSFHFKKLSPVMCAVSMEPVEIRTDVTGVIVSLVDNKYGVIKFPCNDGGTEKAYFSAKSVFKDGWHYTGDPTKLPAMEFDGYRVLSSIGDDGQKEYTWYAVLVWCGRKPSAKFSATKKDLSFTPNFSHGITFNKMARGLGVSLEDKMSPTGDADDMSSAAAAANASPTKSAYMQVGEVLHIRKEGAEVSLGKDSEDHAFIPGWSNRNAKFKGQNFLTTTQGVELMLKDLISFKLDPLQEKKGYIGVGYNIMVLKHADNKRDAGDPEDKKKRRNRKPSEAASDKSGKRERGPKSYLKFLLVDDLLQSDEEAEDRDRSFAPPSEDEDLEYSCGSDTDSEEYNDLVRDAGAKDFDAEDLRKKMAEFEAKEEEEKLAAAKKAQEDEEDSAKKEEDSEDKPDASKDKSAKASVSAPPVAVDAKAAAAVASSAAENKKKPGEEEKKDKK